MSQRILSTNVPSLPEFEPTNQDLIKLPNVLKLSNVIARLKIFGDQYNLQSNVPSLLKQTNHDFIEVPKVLKLTIVTANFKNFEDQYN